MSLYVSSLGTVSGLILAALTGRRFGHDWIRIPITFLLPFAFFAIAARIWTVLYGLTAYWLVPFILLVGIPLSLPLLKPEWSELVMREQYNPQTQLGKRLLNWGLRVMGSAGVMGYSLASFLSDNYGYEFTLVFMASFGSIVAAGLTQVFAHQVIHGTYGG